MSGGLEQVVSAQRNPVDFELADFWYWLNERQRIALCVLSGVHISVAGSKWSQLSTTERMTIIRGMTELGALALESATALATARAELRKQMEKG